MSEGGDASPRGEDDRKVRASISNAIHHLETVESSLEPFDANKNREARRRLEDALERLREGRDTGTYRCPNCTSELENPRRRGEFETPRVSGWCPSCGDWSVIIEASSTDTERSRGEASAE
jgi:rubrerythrin